MVPYRPKIIEKAIAWPLVAPVAAGAWKVGAELALEVKTYPAVPAAVVAKTVVDEA